MEDKLFQRSSPIYLDGTIDDKLCGNLSGWNKTLSNGRVFIGFTTDSNTTGKVVYICFSSFYQLSELERMNRRIPSTLLIRLAIFRPLAFKLHFLFEILKICLYS